MKVFREEFRRELAKRILNILLNKDVELAKQAVTEALHEKNRKSRPSYVQQLPET
jgi:hypothetical protein